jgi:hypothetical protein
LSGPKLKAPGFAGGYLLDAILIDALRSAIGAQQQTDIAEQEIDNAARRARPERRDELCEKLTPAIIDALAPLGAKMPEGEPIGIRVEWKINITPGSNGVRREENEDIRL